MKYHKNLGMTMWSIHSNLIFKLPLEHNKPLKRKVWDWLLYSEKHIWNWYNYDYHSPIILIEATLINWRTVDFRKIVTF